MTSLITVPVTSVGDVLEGIRDKTLSSETVQVVIHDDGGLCANLNQEESDLMGTDQDEPPAKRSRLEDEPSLDPKSSIKTILFNINKAICLRLDAIENKLASLVQRTRSLEDKVEQISTTQSDLNILEQHSPNKPYGDNGLWETTPPSSGVNRKSGPVVVGLPQEKGGSGVDQGVQALGPNVTLITLNSEDDHPNGTWLGDENNPEMRVRVPVTPSDLLHIHSNCRTAEKTALSLLDYLFDRETQASSNLSGMGKHNKKQLDPLMIYGIRCHLIHRFGITEQDWHRIKQNIDSKCRTAFRRREVDLQNAGVLQATTAAELIQRSGGQIQVLHATPEQVAQLQQSHQIQILQGDQVMQLQSGGDTSDSVHVTVGALDQQGAIQVITTDNGPSVHIKADPEHMTDDDLRLASEASGDED